MKKLLIGTILIMTGCHNPHDVAVANFVDYANSLKIQYQSYNCNNWDSDGDDYISCSYVDSKDEIHQLECVGYMVFSFNNGCRVPKMNVRINNTYTRNE